MTRQAEAAEMRKFAVSRIAKGDISHEEAVAVLMEFTPMDRQDAELMLRVAQDEDGDEGETRAPRP